jgi:ADP-ribose pyrophosphatase YjhB (NUDIX family)
MLNALFRLGYRSLYRAARAWWFIRRPRTSGAVVALWSGGRVLLLRTSYRPHYSLPGGFVKASETPAQGAARELFEELQIDVRPSELRAAWRGTAQFENREDSISVFEYDLDRTLTLEPNGREVVWIGWRTPAEALDLLLLPHVREYLAARRV